MATKWKKYSYNWVTKLLVFMITILCFTGAVTVFVKSTGIEENSAYLESVVEQSYYYSYQYMGEADQVIGTLKSLIEDYKNEAHILEGGSITEEEITREEENLYSEFRGESNAYNYHASHEENYNNFKQLYADKISEIKDRLIEEDLKAYRQALQRLESYKEITYYGSDGENVFANTRKVDKDDFKDYSSYIIVDQRDQEVYPEEVKENTRYSWISRDLSEIKGQSKMYIGFTDEFINPRVAEWQEKKAYLTNKLYWAAGLLLGFLVAFIYLVVVTGRKPSDDKTIHLNGFDKLYVDLNIILCLALSGIWVGAMSFIFYKHLEVLILPVTLIISSLGLVLVLSLIKHLKNRSFIKHTLTYILGYKLFKFIMSIYESGSVGVKAAVIVIGYPLLMALTFFMFPITIGFALWLVIKKVKDFNAIKEGVEKVKLGQINHSIETSGKGELGKLASNINTITDGLNKAVDNELKSERLKTELITNVSHDIRTPLTSIITYVDLMKKEEHPEKAKEYLEIIEQKSQRLKSLTEDLFEASKASSGTIPVNLEKIDLVSLITQGLGELDDQIQTTNLDFKINDPKDKIYVKADGKLLWRAIENLLSNIFKYALKGSRVYIDIEDLGDDIKLTMKNISSYELNIPTEELMERFKRGDEARSSDGSGLGLSIAESLINIQSGSFDLEIDGDLFKAMIKIPKYKDDI